MEVGQVVDFVIEYNNMMTERESGAVPKPTRRKATQADWDELLGG